MEMEARTSNLTHRRLAPFPVTTWSDYEPVQRLEYTWEPGVNPIRTPVTGEIAALIHEFMYPQSRWGQASFWDSVLAGVFAETVFGSAEPVSSATYVSQQTFDTLERLIAGATPSRAVRYTADEFARLY